MLICPAFIFLLGDRTNQGARALLSGVILPVNPLCVKKITPDNAGEGPATLPREGNLPRPPRVGPEFGGPSRACGPHPGGGKRISHFMGFSPVFTITTGANF